jgi:membrane protease YdiL (CAAX protease family)
MRSFLLFVGLLAASLIVAAAVTYPAWWLVSTVSIEPVHRVMNRVAMLFALIGLIVLTRRLGLASREATGYGLPRREFVRQLALGWLCGLALMLPLVFTLLGLDVILGAIVSGLVVAFVEETFFRGVLFTAVARTSSVIAAVVTPSLLYAALHFLGGKLRLAPDEVSWLDGFTVLGRLFERYTEPLTFVDSFVALAMLGVLLSLVRLRTGAIAACIGLHAAGVATIAVLRDVTIVDRGSEYAAIVGSYDGVIGWAALAWFSLIGTAYVLLGRKKVAGGS